MASRSVRRERQRQQQEAAAVVRDVRDGPTKERRAQGGLVRVGYVWVSLDTLARMERAGTIDARMRRAGVAFHDQFQLAGLNAGLFAADPTRVPVHMGGRRGPPERNEACYLQIVAALDALGGVSTARGSCAWHVLGCEKPLTEWATTLTWSGRPVHHQFAAGILLAALESLRIHYGF